MRSTLIIIPLLLLYVFSSAQESRLDRLKRELKNAANDTLRMAYYTELGGYYYERKVDSALYFSEQSILLAQELKLKAWEASELGVKGNLLMIMKNYPGSYQSILQGLKIAEDPKSEKTFWFWRFMPKETTPQMNRLKALVYLRQGLDNLYRLTGDTTKRILENLKSKQIARELNDSALLSFATNSLGQIYFDRNKLDSALAFYQEALEFSMFTGFQNQRPQILVGIGNVYYKKENKALAKQYYLDALQLSRARNNRGSTAQAYCSLASLFRDEGERDSSLYYATKCRELFENLNSLVGKETVYTILASVYNLRSNSDSAFKYQGLAIAAKDSLNETENLKKYMNISFEEQLRVQELEKDKIQFRNKVRTTMMLAGIGVLLLLSIIFYRNIRQKQKAKAKIEKAYNEVERQKEKSDELLLNILPYEVAEELKEKGYTTAKSFDEVTVLFSDIKGFTNVAEKLTAQELVKEINTYFSAFDNIIQKYGLEKIKTIGDAYIAAGGLPEKNSATAHNVIEAAIAMQQEVERLKQQRVSSNKPYFELRIGIHTGPVVAGVVGIKKFQYDIWGDTVNLAARMEQSGVPGKINISQHTYELVKGRFNCVHRGRIEAKNKGEIEMYFVG
ncbi:MAG TPA: adenylate/guanylate cyclase domain-containing protein [Chitinophagaceae bacterium]|nr:adenylate/guanylate cyclase domain-containing protein [Chitinophagaceae bacterium]